jgi:hypothetical protein
LMMRPVADLKVLVSRLERQSGRWRELTHLRGT